MAVSANSSSVRALALARRKAMSSRGKNAVGAQSTLSRTRAESAPATPATPAAPVTPAAPPRAAVRRPAARPVAAVSSARKASLERRLAMSSRGKVASGRQDRTRGVDDRASARRDAGVAAAAPAKAAEIGDCGCGCGGSGRSKAAAKPVKAASGSRARTARNSRPAIAQNSSKAVALARRRAQSSRGKAGISKQGMSEAQTARAVNPQLSGRELAKTLREQRSKRGACGQKKSAPTGRRRKASDSAPGAAQDAPWKVGASETARGQTVTGTMVGRDKAVTGDEASTCRAVTGTEYLGADIFREFCQAEPVPSPQRGGNSSTAHGSSVTGNQVGRSSKVTGDEPGTCKRVTGSEYLSSEQLTAYCGSAPEAGANRVTSAETRHGKVVTGNNIGRTSNVTGGEAGADRELTGTQYTNVAEGGAPAKVGESRTLRGGSISGTLVGRREKMTGDEAGSCRTVTGDEYIGEEQFTSFCNTKPDPQDQKVGKTRTFAGEEVTGSMTGRSMKVTGNEPGTCKSITGTPYAGVEDYGDFCEAPASAAAKARLQPNQRYFGSVMTGQQPAVGGKMTGDNKGACEPVTGTPYIGADQAAMACPAVAAEPGAPDFPKPVGGQPWTEFSVDAPSHASQQPANRNHVTGSSYEAGQITGPFGKAGGKVTGTEEARFGSRNTDPAPMPESAAEIDGRVKSRITGEGQNAGLKITGDDWDRGDRVTGTEGVSATRRNSTLRGAPTGAMGFRATAPAEAPAPVSKVTGASGNSANGSLITYSGGARG